MLVYVEEQAPHEQTMIKNSLRENRPYPKAILNAPILELEHIFYYQAFNELGTSRYFAGGPIPYNEIVNYGELFDLDSNEIAELLIVIRAIDIHMLNYWYEKQKRKKGKGKKSNGGGKRP